MKRRKADINIPEELGNPELLYPVRSLEESGAFKRVPPNVKSAIDKLQTLARKYRLELESLRDAELEVKQEWIIAEPNVYVARTKDIKTEREYFTAKTFWPLKNGKTKEVKIYLGRAEDFNNDTMSIQAREFAKSKMSETLRRRKDDGEI